MNEEKNLQELFETIESSVSASDGLRRRVQDHLDSRKKHRFGRRVTWAGAFAFGTVAVVVGLMAAPVSSVARTLGRFDRAVLNVKFMHVRSYTVVPNGPRKLVGETYYADGAWRFETLSGSRFARTYIRSNGKQWLYLASSNVSVGEPATDSPFDGTPCALDLAKLRSDSGETDAPRKYAIESRPDEHGRPVYAVIGTKPGTDYHMELVVDKRTDLPIRSSFSQPDSEETVVEEYSYDEPFGPSLFDPKVNALTRVFDLRTEAAKWQDNWKLPLKTVTWSMRHMDLRSVCQNDRGEVFMVCSFGNASPENVEESYKRALLPTEIEDDLGRRYVLAVSTEPGGTFADWGEKERLVFGDDRVKLQEWVPLRPSANWQPATSLQVVCDNGDPIRGFEPAPVEFPIGRTISSRLPAYNDPMLLGYYDMQFDSRSSYARGRYWEDLGDYGQAAHWYQDAATQAPGRGMRLQFEAEAKRCLGRLPKTP